MGRDILKLRIRWFHLLAKNFIVRYQMGLLVLVMFLPGVAIGDNFNLLLKAMTLPFQVVSDTAANFTEKILWLFLFQVVFVVWVRAQKSAINGGGFAIYQQSLPITERSKSKINVSLLIYANHLLWPIIVASYFYLQGEHGLEFINALFRNSFLVLLLLSVQYIAIFCLQPKAMLIQLSLSLLFLVGVDQRFELLRLILLMPLWIYLVFYILQPVSKTIKLNASKKTANKKVRPSNFITANLHYQILFKSCISSTLFRLTILLFLITGFILSSNHFLMNNNENLLPYALALEGLIAYYVSGFFVNFSDQRNNMKQLLISLPVKKLFWPVRDILIVLLLTTVLHGFLFMWESRYLSMNTLLLLLIYQFFLLFISYPIRVFVKNKQTHISFSVIFILTVIAIYNLS